MTNQKSGFVGREVAHVVCSFLATFTLAFKEYGRQVTTYGGLETHPGIWVVVAAVAVGATFKTMGDTAWRQYLVHFLAIFTAMMIVGASNWVAVYLFAASICAMPVVIGERLGAFLKTRKLDRNQRE